MDDCTVCTHPAGDHAYWGTDIGPDGVPTGVSHCQSITWTPADPACTCGDYRDKAGQNLYTATPRSA